MGYHDRDTFERWHMSDNDKRDKPTENPRIQVISPQKKLYDIQQLINILPNKHMTTFELQDAIQKILDGENYNV